MADGRMLKKTIANSKKLAMVSDRAKVIWFMILPHADVKGRANACPLIVKGQYLTMLQYNTKMIQKALLELHEAGLIILYTIQDNQYLEFTRFSDFQALRPDRESESKIPPPESGITPGVVPDNSGLSKDKLSKDNIIIISIFDHWNRQSDTGKWKTHRKLTPDIFLSIASNLKAWPPEDIKQAISNFALILQGKDYLWTYDKWGLREFLSRHEKNDRKALQWWRFHPNNFREEDWLTEQAKQRRIKSNRGKDDIEKFITRYKDWIMDTEPSVLIQRSKSDPRIRLAVKRLRPEIELSEEK